MKNVGSYCKRSFYFNVLRFPAVVPALFNGIMVMLAWIREASSDSALRFLAPGVNFDERRTVIPNGQIY